MQNQKIKLDFDFFKNIIMHAAYTFVHLEPHRNVHIYMKFKKMFELLLLFIIV